VLAAIPGWENATAAQLEGGRTNRAWLVDANGRRAVLKIDVEARGAPYNSRRAEAAVQTAAASHGLANPVLFVNEQVYLTEYRDGRVWTHEDLHDENKLTDLGHALRNLHALPPSGRTFDANAAMRVYLENIPDRGGVTLRRCVDIVTLATRSSDLCLCHNDLVAENILSVPEIRFLDWEYACDNDPCFDLATLIAHHDLTDAQADLLVHAYSGGRAARAWPRIVEQLRLYDALHWLWLEAQPDPERHRDELAAIAARLG